MDTSLFIEAAIDMISNVGFPIFVSLYLLQRMEKQLEDMVDAIKQLNESLSQLHQQAAQD